MLLCCITISSSRGNQRSAQEVAVSNFFIGSLVGEELDEIQRVIELVLLGLDP